MDKFRSMVCAINKIPLTAWTEVKDWILNTVRLTETSIPHMILHHMLFDVASAFQANAVSLDNKVAIFVFEAIRAASLPTRLEWDALVGRTVFSRQDGKDLDLNWRGLADKDSTLVIYMGLENIGEISHNLIAAGLPGYTPAAAIEKGTTPEQRTIITTVAELADCARAEDLKAPTPFIIGEVVEFSESLSWAAAVIDCGLEAHG